MKSRQEGQSKQPFVPYETIAFDCSVLPGWVLTWSIQGIKYSQWSIVDSVVGRPRECLRRFVAEPLYRYVGDLIVVVIAADQECRLNMLSGRQRERITERRVVLEDVR